MGVKFHNLFLSSERLQRNFKYFTVGLSYDFLRFSIFSISLDSVLKFRLQIRKFYEMYHVSFDSDSFFRIAGRFI